MSAAGRAGLALRLALVLAVLAALLPLHLVLDRARRPGRIARLFLGATAALLGLRHRLAGVAPARPALYVANHVSWADIVVLGAALDASFIAKREVADWPLVGWLARRHATLFVDRARRGDAHRQQSALAERLAAGGSVVLFAEGTTGTGADVAPFKSALFAAVEGSDALVQPVTIVWEEVGRRPVDAARRGLVAWADDTAFGAHAARLIAAGGAGAVILLHSPVRAADFPSRRALADHCRAVVAGGLDAALRERHQGAG